MGDILTLAKKLERAMRNGTGFQVTPEEITAMVDHDVVDAVYAAKLQRLKSQCQTGNTRSAITGSTSGAMASRPSGKSADIPRSLDRSYIAALSAKT